MEVPSPVLQLFPVLPNIPANNLHLSSLLYLFHAGNENDSLAIKLGVSKNDPLHDEKVALLTSLGLPSSGSFMLIPGLHPISPGLLAFTRIFCMDKGEEVFLFFFFLFISSLLIFVFYTYFCGAFLSLLSLCFFYEYVEELFFSCWAVLPFCKWLFVM